MDRLVLGSVFVVVNANVAVGVGVILEKIRALFQRDLPYGQKICTIPDGSTTLFVAKVSFRTILLTDVLAFSTREKHPGSATFSCSSGTPTPMGKCLAV